MKRLQLTVAAGLLALSPAFAAAQSAEPPRLEIGAQVSGQTNERSGLTWTPRLTINLRPDTALEFSGDVRQPTKDPFRLEESGQAVSIHLRQTLWENGRWQVSGVVGGGVRRSTIFFPGYTIQRPEGPVTYPDSRFVEYGAAAHIGPSVQLQVARRLLLRADVRMDARLRR